MRQCKICQVKVSTNDKVCPLCQSVLMNDKDNGRYPNIVNKEKYPLWIKIVFLVLTVLLLISIMLSMFVFHRIHLAMVSFGIYFSFWIVLGTVLKHKKHFMISIMKEYWMLFILGLLWDIFTGWHQWFFAYYYPFLTMLYLVALFVLTLVFRHRIMNDFMEIYLNSYVGLFSIYCLSYSFLLSFFCLIITLFIISYFSIFQGKYLKQEIIRYFSL